MASKSPASNLMLVYYAHCDGVICFTRLSKLQSTMKGLWANEWCWMHVPSTQLFETKDHQNTEDSSLM